MSDQSKKQERFTNATGAPVPDNTNIMTAGPRGPALLQDIWLIEKLAHFDREVIPERRMHAKGWGAYGTFTTTHDITKYTKAAIFSKVGKQTPMFVRFSTVAGERGAADAERDIRGTAIKFYTEEGNWDIVGNNTPVFFFRDPLRFSDLNHAIKRDPRTGLRSTHRSVRSNPITAMVRCVQMVIWEGRSLTTRIVRDCGTTNRNTLSRRFRSKVTLITMTTA